MEPRTRLAGLRIIALGCALLLATAAAQAPRQPAPGVLLVASEQMADPRFNRSVVLLVEHDRTGSWGLIINKPTDIGVAEIAPSVAAGAEGATVYFGGPVQVNQLRVLYRDGKTGGGATGLPGVRWSGSVDVLSRHLQADPLRARIYAGYAGWAPGQLDFELAHGGWRLIEGRAGNVFSDEPEQLWRRLNTALDGIAI
ncbi:MAG TPA: YqgE/AlgH family protein [Arenicellales bacterium]|nr:YqgE/AlgH family protein [Arenicellales bacterium]